MVTDYEEQVYAAVLGKVIGVYLGRPVEGWTMEAIEAKWPMITRYIHRDLGLPLVVADDDIAGTWTFVKALSDSGLLGKTPAGFIGDTWLNYLIENRAVLWWGGIGNSTEHTAWIRLRQGYRAPASGSIELNGRTVAEQIGAQIFIDGFGIVAPGNPALAASLARKAASVSHDGEALIAAQAVAMLVSMAFREKRMDRLLDRLLERIPADSVIARIHRDVRGWAAVDGDWRKTFRRIKRRYGYDRYGGGCHVVPNHAVMVMAWAYGQEDFFRAITIAASAGWDTDCNAGNVGTVSALVAGLGRLSETYDFQTPFADTVLIPTADGTDGVTDCLRISRSLAALGRQVMAMAPVRPTKGGACHRFEMAGALHGYRAEEGSGATIGNVPSPVGTGRALHVVAPGPARISTPMIWRAPAGQAGGELLATPGLYRAMTVVVRGEGGALHRQRIRPFTRHDKADGLRYPPEATLVEPNAPFTIRWTLDDVPSSAITDFGLEIAPVGSAGSELFVESVDFQGEVRLFPEDVPDATWISTLKQTPAGSSIDLGRGYRITGNRTWGDETIQADLEPKVADCTGLILRWQGLERHYALEITKTSARIVRVCYGRTVLAERPLERAADGPLRLLAAARGETISLVVDGQPPLVAEDRSLPVGGVGFFIETGSVNFTRLQIGAKVV